MSDGWGFEVGDYVWYQRDDTSKRYMAKVTEDCPTDADFEITFFDGDTKWVKSWYLEHATNEEAMLATLEN